MNNGKHKFAKTSIRMKHLKTLIFIGLLLPGVLQAQKQSKKQMYATYQEGKKMLVDQKYTEAMTRFKTLMVPLKNNVYEEFAYYYYGLAALKSKQTEESKQAFTRLIEKFPDWVKKEEVYYAFGDIFFREKDYKSALKYLNWIKAEGMQNDIANMKGFYLVSVDLAELKKIQGNNPNDKVIGQLLVNKIAANSEDLKELDMMEALIESLKLERPTNQKVKGKIFTKKEYNIAVILPFNLEVLKSRERNRLSRISASLYQGMRLAKQELDSTGIKLNLIAFDVLRKGDDTLNLIMKEGNMTNIDLIVGPLFDKQFQKVAEFANQNKINIINPISNKSALVKNDFIMMYEPSLETQGRKSAEFAVTQLSSKKAMVFYGRSTKNKTIAENHKQAVEANGGEVAQFQQLSTSNITGLKQMLKKANPAEIGHIFISSSSQLVASQMLKVLNELSIKAPVIALDSWLKFQKMDTVQYERQNVHIIDPEFISESVLKTTKFYQAYKNTTKVAPNNYACAGYDLMHYFGRLLKQHGVKTSLKNIVQKKQPKKGQLINGFDFRGASDNQFVPIVKFNKGILTQVNSFKEN